MSIIATQWKLVDALAGVRPRGASRQFGLAGFVVGSVLAAFTVTNSAAAGLWTILPMPGLVSSDIWLADVSCSSAASCTGVGFYQSTTSTIVTLAERWTGGTWTIQPTPNPSGAQWSSFNGVACPSATSCIGVGAYRNTSGTLEMFAERWDGSTWTLQPMPNPVGATASTLNGVSCLSATACVAVGGYENTGSTYLTLVERWNGSVWTIDSTPNYAGLNHTLLGVSCTSPTACLAVGYTYTTSLGQPLAMAWNGHVWGLEQPPLPSTSTVGRLTGVSCVSALACTAVGWFADSSGTSFPLAEFSPGNDTWKIQYVPKPDDATPAGLAGVSCTSATACVAVGSFRSWSGHWMALSETFNGTTWTEGEPPDPSSAAQTYLSGVSCQSATACIAVGTYATSPSSGGTLSEIFS